jgi:hypothetical protein
MIGRTLPLSAIPKRISTAPHRCRFPAPLRKSIRTEDGWIDREWRPGEKAAYEEKVLHRPQITRFTLV